MGISLSLNRLPRAKIPWRRIARVSVDLLPPDVIVVLDIVLEVGDPILKLGLAICDPCGPKGWTLSGSKGGGGESAAVTCSPPLIRFPHATFFSSFIAV